MFSPVIVQFEVFHRKEEQDYLGRSHKLQWWRRKEKEKEEKKKEKKRTATWLFLLFFLLFFPIFIFSFANNNVSQQDSIDNNKKNEQEPGVFFPAILVHGWGFRKLVLLVLLSNGLLLNLEPTTHRARVTAGDSSLLLLEFLTKLCSRRNKQQKPPY